MTSHHGRLYALAASVLLFFVVWAGIAARPWATTKAATRDPRLVALAQREQRLRKEAGLVQQVVTRRYADYRRQFAAYKVALARRQAQIAAASRRLHSRRRSSRPSSRPRLRPPRLRAASAS